MHNSTEDATEFHETTVEEEFDDELDTEIDAVELTEAGAENDAALEDTTAAVEPDNGTYASYDHLSGVLARGETVDVNRLAATVAEMMRPPAPRPADDREQPRLDAESAIMESHSGEVVQVYETGVHQDLAYDEAAVEGLEVGEREHGTTVRSA